MVQTLKLKGHKTSVLSLAHSSATRSFANQESKNKQHEDQNNSLCHLLSGDESGNTRVWDLRCDSKRSSHCIIAPYDGNERDVTAVGFHPFYTTDTTGSIEQRCPFTVYTAVGCKVYGYDLRYIKDPSIITQPDFYISSIDGGEEINCIDFLHFYKQKKTFLVTADDDGMVRVFDSIPGEKSKEGTTEYSSALNTTRPFRIYQHSEDELTLVTSVAFRPRSIKSMDMATAGTDCTICLWDINRPHHNPSSTLFVKQDDNTNKSGVNQICNPPIVHSLSWSPSGSLLAAALGDGTCLIADIEKRKLVEKCRLRDGHHSAVASVLFPNFGLASTTSSHVSADDRLIISAGSDGNILLWDLGLAVAGSNAVNPSKLFACHANDCSQVSNNECIDEASKALGTMSLSQQNPQILLGIPHNEKINFMVCSSSHDPVLSNSLFVSDIREDITVYLLPVS